MDGGTNVQNTGGLRVPVTEVRPYPHQPRTYFKQSALESLARSIVVNGQRTPIQVKLLPPEDTHRYEIIDGERRWRAHLIAKLPTIRISVEDTVPDERAHHMLSLISNHHREGQTHMEISNAIQFQVDREEKVTAIAEALDKSTAWVYQYLQLQKLVPELQERMHPETRDKQLLRFGEGVALSSLPPEHQLTVYRKMLKVPLPHRLKCARSAIEEITGVKRTGRPRDVGRFAQRLFDRLSADMDKYLDMHEKEFRQVIAGSSAHDLKTLKARLEELAKQANALVLCIDNGMMLG